MSRTDCPSPDEWSSFLWGDGTDAQLATLASHLEGCPRCEAAVTELENTLGTGVAALGRAGRLGPVAAPPPARVGGYDVQGELGRGGMGVVYRAWHAALGRAVALKVLRDASLAGPEERGRFEAEARAVARLRHPNIVQVFDTGEWSPPEGGAPCPFVVLELVEGGSLAARCRGQPQEPRRAAWWVADLARAAHHAHQAGIVHRDIKPQNVLLSADGQVKLCDFGIAKDLRRETATGTGVLVGTLGYLAPEQVDRAVGPIGPATDVHALGVLLYELLTGRLPFSGKGPAEILRAVMEGPPAALAPGEAPEALEAVCLKCLQKGPANRYVSAAELADDLGRYLNGEPVRARLVGPLGRAAGWAWRRARWLALGAATLALGAVFGWLATRPGPAEGVPGPEPAPPVRPPAPPPRPPQGLPDYLALLSRADKAWQLRARPGPLEILKQCSDERRHWEWYHLRQRFRPPDLTLEGHAKDVYAACYSPDGGLLAAAGDDGAVLVVDTKSGKQLHRFKAGAAVRCLAFLPAGKEVASGGRDGVVALWELPTGKKRILGRHGDEVTGLAVTRGGKALVSAAPGRPLQGWALPSGERAFTIPEPAGTGPILVAGGPSVARLAVARGERGALFDAATLRPVGGQFTAPRDVNALAFGPDGKQLTVASNGAVFIYDGATGAAAANFNAEGPGPSALAGSADGLLIATGADDGTVRLWSAPAARALSRPLLLTLRGVAAPARAVAVHPRGVQVAAAVGRVVHLWEAAPGRREAAYLNTGLPQPVMGLALGPGDRVLAAGAGDGVVAAWGLEGQAALPPFEGPIGLPRHLAWSPDGELLVASGTMGGQVWRAEGRKRLHRLPALSNPTFDRAGRLLAFFGADRKVAVCEARTGKVVLSMGPRAHPVRALALNAAGDRLAEAGAPAEGVQVWEVPSGKEAYSLRAKEYVGAPAFSPDGRYLATSFGRAVRLWDARTGKPVRTLTSEGMPTLWQCFSPDGKRLACGTGDELVRIWDVEGEMVVLTLEGFGGQGPVVWGPAGRRIAVGERAEGGIRVFDAPGFGAGGPR